VGRVALAPVIIALILVDTRETAVVAAIVFVVGAATDGLDGWLARRYRSTSRTGMWLDPLADKVIVAAAVVTLSALGRFPVWAMVLILVREVGIAVLRWRLEHRGRSMPATRAATLKTAFQLGAITLYILPLRSWADGLRLAVLSIAVALTLATGILYLMSARRLALEAGGPAA
jgi:CDP-diacylglycerol--glycerol-3-phosphate 3-phosphatidyltransferase